MELYSHCAEIACPQAAEDIKALVKFAAAQGVALRDSDHDLAAEVGEHLPEHLQALVNAEVEQLLSEEVPHDS